MNLRNLSRNSVLIQDYQGKTESEIRIDTEKEHFDGKLRAVVRICVELASGYVIRNNAKGKCSMQCTTKSGCLY